MNNNLHESQFSHLYKKRLLELERDLELSEHKWQIRQLQVATGHDCCFLTDERYHCKKEACLFRHECLALCAEWQR
jgi:hypothetical protein